MCSNLPLTSSDTFLFYSTYCTFQPWLGLQVCTTVLFFIKIFFINFDHVSPLLTSPRPFPPSHSAKCHVLFLFPSQKEKRKSTKTSKTKVTKQNTKAQKPWSPFYVGQLLLGIGADWNVVDITVLEKTDFLFLCRYQLQIISWLEAGLYVCFRFSAEVLLG